MNETEKKIEEAKVQLDNKIHNKLRRAPIVKNTQARVNEIIDQMHRSKHIDDTNNKWLSQTPHPRRRPIFCTLTKTDKRIPVGRPIISGFDGLTERILFFEETLLQAIAKQSYIKDTTAFIKKQNVSRACTQMYLKKKEQM